MTSFLLLVFFVAGGSNYSTTSVTVVSRYFSKDACVAAGTVFRNSDTYARFVCIEGDK